MSDLIDRQAAIIALLEKGQKSRRYKLGEFWELNFDEIREALATVPSAEPERKTGKWIEDGYYGLPCVCSYCGTEGKREWKYCPNCGTRMAKA